MKVGDRVVIVSDGVRHHPIDFNGNRGTITATDGEHFAVNTPKMEECFRNSQGLWYYAEDLMLDKGYSVLELIKECYSE